jgi:NAD(P)-dependent dehydrogenase (short-subunit alcohol dehydrogenase family)
MNLKDSVAIVTGGGRGIGAATAHLAAERGYRVCVNYRKNADAAEAVVARITAAGGSAIAVRADVAVEADVLRLFEACDAQLGPLTALVNNAGILEKQSRVEQIDAARLGRIFATNVTGAFLFSQAIAPMLSQNASLVHIGSVNGVLAGAGLGAYKVSKAALHMLARWLAVELAADPRRIRVNVVAPGWVDTPGERRTFTDKQITLARGIAAHAAGAIDRAQLHVETERRRREAEVFAELVQTINASLDLDTILQSVAEWAKERAVEREGEFKTLLVYRKKG